MDKLKFSSKVALRDLELIKQDTVGLRESEKMLRGTRAAMLRVRQCNIDYFIFDSSGNFKNECLSLQSYMFFL